MLSVVVWRNFATPSVSERKADKIDTQMAP